jgi:hypothetical protein
VALRLQFRRQGEGTMLRFLKKVLMFKIGQRTSRRFARAIGVHRPIASLVGLIGGFKYMRGHA